MTLFLYSAAGPDGKRRAGRIDAASLDAAKFLLEQRNLSAIVFHTDEMSAAGMKAEGLAPPEVDADTELAHRTTPPQGFAFVRACYVGNWIVWVPTLAWVVWNLWHGAPYTFVDWLSFVLAALGLVFPAYAAIPSLAYQRLLDASAWARWSEVRRHCAFFRRWGRWLIGPLPRLDIDIRDASAVAATGDLQAALDSVAHYAEGMPRHTYLSRIVQIHIAACDWTGATRCLEEAWRLSGGATAETVDYATTLVWRLRDADRAEQLLAGVADKTRSSLVQAFFDYATGMVALERGNPAAAKTALLDAIGGVATHINPSSAALIDFIQAHLVIALGELGEKRTARAVLRGVLPRLTAFKAIDLARRCAAAVA